MSINGFYKLIVSCDVPVCNAKMNLIAKGNRWVRGEEATAKNFSQARMQLIRDGWKIRKNKVICPDCISAGVRVRDLDPRRKKRVEENSSGPESPTTNPVSANGGTDTPGVPG
jgi:hypothetical protein